MQKNNNDLEKQLAQAKEQITWLRQNFNQEINLLIQENRDLKEQVKSIDIKKVIEPVIEAKIIQAKELIIETIPEKKVEQQNSVPSTPAEMSSIQWLFEWFICKCKDYFFKLPYTLALLAYHIFAIQYHKHLCNKR
ncbi:MAG: hypothetical protein COB02_05715 [Candidatus Cloacimonadota bacterium]|nr:MAG: hypothetical protein COB02_05715 [Candidatus Cloacimonadota bacterium]